MCCQRLDNGWTDDTLPGKWHPAGGISRGTTLLRRSLSLLRARKCWRLFLQRFFSCFAAAVLSQMRIPALGLSPHHLFCSILFQLRLNLLGKSNCWVVNFLAVLDLKSYTYEKGYIPFCRAITLSRSCVHIHRIAHFCGTPIGAELLFVCANVCRWPTSLGKR